MMSLLSASMSQLKVTEDWEDPVAPNERNVGVLARHSGLGTVVGL